MSLRREHFTGKPRPIAEMIEVRESIRVRRPDDPSFAVSTPLEPLYEVGSLVEEANAKYMEAAKIAYAAEIPEAHLYVQEARVAAADCQQKLAAITARDES